VPGRLHPRALGIEALDHICDITFAGDALPSPLRRAPRAVASLRNLAIGILGGTATRQAAALGHTARDATRVLPLLGIIGREPGTPPVAEALGTYFDPDEGFASG
jgi:hypothetical protein